MKNFKKFTYKMIRELGKKVKDINLEEWGYTKNTPNFIEIINRNTGEKRVINKNEFGISTF